MMTCKKIRAIALTLALALVAAFCGCFITACDNSGGNGGNDDTDEPKDTISLAVSSVSTGDDDLSTYVINASVNVQLTPRWAITWENADSEWASGKSVSDYLKLDLSNGNLTATVTCLQAFGETAVLTATIGQGSLAVSASKCIGYDLVETYELSSDGTYYVVKKGRNVECYTIGIRSEYKGLPVKRLSSYAFRYCSSLKGVTIPDTVLSIGVRAFSDCSSLNTVYLSKSLTIIEAAVFENCSSLVDFEIPLSVTFMGDNVFSGCSSLEEIVIPDSIETIYSNVFVGCTSLKNVTFLGDKSKIYISAGAFRDCPYQP